MALFQAKTCPIATYELELVWEMLTTLDLQRLESVKARYLKRMLGVATTTPSRLVYELSREPFFVEELRTKLFLPTTPAEQKHLESRRKKREEIWLDFYSTEAMIDRGWERENQDLRHLFTRLSVHGFHHKLCDNKRYHDPDEKCACRLCVKVCDRYHITRCEKRVRSLSDYAKE